MSLGLREISLNIINRLQPVGAALSVYGVRLRSLPKEPKKIGSAEPHFITVSVRQAKGKEPTGEGAQEVIYLVKIHLCLGKLYQELPEEKDVLYWAIDNVTVLLLGFIPFASKSIARRSLWFESYEFQQPSNGQWEAYLNFQCSKIMSRSLQRIDDDDDTIVESVRLYSSPTLSDLNECLLLEILNQNS